MLAFQCAAGSFLTPPGAQLPCCNFPPGLCLELHVAVDGVKRGRWAQAGPWVWRGDLRVSANAIWILPCLDAPLSGCSPDVEEKSRASWRMLLPRPPPKGRPSGGRAAQGLVPPKPSVDPIDATSTSLGFCLLLCKIKKSTFLLRPRDLTDSLLLQQPWAGPSSANTGASLASTCWGTRAT